MFSSPVVKMDKDVGKDDATWRTSRQAWLETDATVVTRGLSERVAAVLSVPIIYQESLQVLNYGPAQKYDVHLDAFDPHFYSEQKDFITRIDGGHRNRLATAFWYMSEVAEGGETIFPRAGGLAHPYETNVDRLREQRVGLLVEPRRGKIIIFYNLLPSGTIDQMSLHGGCPVIKVINAKYYLPRY